MNRRKFIKTLGLSAVVLPVVAMLGESKPKVIYTDGNIDHEPWTPIDNPGFETTTGRPWKGDEWWLQEDHAPSKGKLSNALIEDARKYNVELIKAIFDLT